MNSRHLAHGRIALAKHPRGVLRLDLARIRWRYPVCCFRMRTGRAKFSKARDSSRRAADLPTLAPDRPRPAQSVPSCSRKRCASSAAMQPVPALVMAWRYTWSCTSPAANTPGTLVMVAKP